MTNDDFASRIAKTDLQYHQREAVQAVFNAIAQKQRKILIEMPVGSGISSVVRTIASLLTDTKDNNVLVLVDRREELEQYEQLFQTVQLGYTTRIANDARADITLLTAQMFFNQASKFLLGAFNYIVCVDAGSINSRQCASAFGLTDATIIAFSRSFHGNELFHGIDPVFSMALNVVDYTESAAIDFLEILFRNNGLTEIRDFSEMHGGEARPDLIMRKGEQCFAVEVKLYRSRTVSNAILERAVLQAAQYKQLADKPFFRNLHCSRMEACLVAFCLMDSETKTRFFQRYGVHILDIANLLYLSQENPEHLNQLARIFPYSIYAIQSVKPDFLLLPDAIGRRQELQEEGKTQAEADILLRRLESCRPGKSGKAAQLYEELCGDIIAYLFDPEFSKKVRQHTTVDKLFRMDLLCALKGTTAFWQFLKQYYNTNFVVFEYKNYQERIQQNLIYTTEKYLFDAALRNVAFILSRKGFDPGARSAALGCLKEDRKLILDITDKDIQAMMQCKKDGMDPSDYMLSKLEDYLMSIGK